MRTTLLCWMIALAALGAGCTPPTQAQADLERHRAMFAQAALPSYELIWSQACACEPDAMRGIKVTVSGNEIVSAVYLDDHLPVSASVRRGLRTIDGVFDMIADRLDDASQVDVSYDAELGYPNSVTVKLYKTVDSDGDMMLQLFDLVTPVKPPDTGKPALRTQLAAARALFVEPASYSFTSTLSCFCGPDTVAPVRITVTNGVVTRAVYRDTQVPLPPERLASIQSLPALFDFIEKELADNSDWRSDELIFEYDPVLHYPTRVQQESAEIADLGFEQRITDFVTPADVDADAISAAQARWNEHRPSAYSYDWQRSCFCDTNVTRRMHISVTGNQITSASFSDDHVAISNAAALGVLTVDGVFAQLQQRLQQGGNAFSLKFDPALDFPSSVYVNAVAGPADGEFAVTISNFVSDAP